MYTKLKNDVESSIISCFNIISFIEDAPKSIVPVWYQYDSTLSDGSGYEYKGKFITEKVYNYNNRGGFYMINFVT